ncbi:MAG: helix-turn-helix domain-containing protein [Ruminococcaceae bacterium]|nr:helix-turn-helix domain-containing protein [Oscillospiraceae bacterium]
MLRQAQQFDPRQTMCRTGFEVFHYRDARPEEVAVHHHDFYEVYLFLSGEVDYWVDGRLYHLQTGDLLLINPLELHRPIVKADNTAYERVVLWIEKKYLENLSIENVSLTRCFDHSRPDHSNLLRPSTLWRTDITARLNALVREYYSEEYGSAVCADGLFLQFMVELNRLALQNDSNLLREESSPLVSKVLAYMAEHYAEELSLDSLAQQFFVSKYHLSHEFSRTVGVGVYRYLTLKRLLIAKQMMDDGVPPGEVFAVCGFRDYTSFYRAFKAEYGLSPRACTGRNE